MHNYDCNTWKLSQQWHPFIEMIVEISSRWWWSESSWWHRDNDQDDIALVVCMIIIILSHYHIIILSYYYHLRHRVRQDAALPRAPVQLHPHADRPPVTELGDATKFDVLLLWFVLKCYTLRLNFVMKTLVESAEFSSQNTKCQLTNLV